MGISLKPQHVKRYKDIAVLLAKYGRSDLVSQVGLDDLDRDLSGPVEGADAEQLASDLERLGPTFIKLGQLMSTRADLLPAPYIAALSRLQDDIEPIPFEDVERIVQAELGVRIGKAFQTFENIPVASASLGQVHKAVLRNGRPVAVKVQRPGIRERVLDDLDALAELAEFADSHTSFGRRYGFVLLLDEFRKSMMRELDYTLEARNLDTLRNNLAEYPRIHVPAPVPDYSTARVLTMDFIGGRKLTSLGPLAQLEVEGRDLADQLIGAYLKQILVDGFFHADPHPGNVFLTDAGDIALVDLGMVGRVPAHMQEQLLKLLLAIGDGRGQDAAKALQSIAERGDDEDMDETEFQRAVGEIVAENQGAELANIRAGTIVIQLSKIAADNGLRTPPELAMLGRALIALDEVARTLDPSYDPNDAIRRQAADILRRRVTGTAQGNIFANLLEAKEFVERLPGRVNKVMDALAEGELKLNVRGIDEREVMAGITKLANRVTTGLVIAALIIGAAMLMRVETKMRIFGYPALGIICFLVAASFGVILLANIWITDHRAAEQRRKRR